MGQGDGQRWGGDAYREDADASAPAAQPGFDGYDMYDVPLGDLMRGERATMGKSLLDVERELRIRATYIAAIENGDIGAFQSPGFIAGYVRSYARYLGMEPEWTFRRFCEETGFRGVHGGTALQPAARAREAVSVPLRVDPNDVMRRAPKVLAPEREPLFARLEPGALGSIAVLVALAVGIGYGAWAILHDIQRLSIAPVEEAPMTLAELDPLAGARGADGAPAAPQGFDIAVPRAEEGGRLFRPEPLETPVLTPRDEALATLDPDEVGTLSGLRPAGQAAGERLAEARAGVPVQRPGQGAVQVTETAREDEVLVFAVRPTWVRITSASGTTLFEGTLNAGDSWALPETEGAPLLRSGNSGSLYFAVNGVTLGPAGVGASIVRDVELSADALSAIYSMADAGADPDLPDVAELVLGVEAE
ncbi:helix-turn-helix domain-containing protein [Roseicyclus sp.]|uniref:helix-turn-helix domain-containing protein n=1 Tax=Roseicyclus sp. TaxID=1914329 RepID=UPI003FA13D3F